MKPIYLDCNASTRLLPEVAAAMRNVEETCGNPSSAHFAGRKARRSLEDARARIAALLNALPDEVTFTSGATEANNLAIFGLINHKLPLHLLVSPLEHPCVIEPIKLLSERGVTVGWMPVSGDGVVELSATLAMIQPSTHLISMMLVNHETGAIQQVGELAAKLPPGILLHCDAAQAVGKLPVDFRTIGATAITATAHKFGGPQGIGILVLKRDTPLEPMIHGGHQQAGRRPGTEPVALAVGMAIALEHAVGRLSQSRQRLESLRASLYQQIEHVAAPIVLNGPALGSANALPTTLNISFPGCRADLLLVALDLAGVACSTGSACSSGSLLPSPVLRAMGLGDDIVRSAIRLSFDETLSDTDVSDAARRIGAAVSELRRRSPGWRIPLGRDYPLYLLQNSILTRMSSLYSGAVVG